MMANPANLFTSFAYAVGAFRHALGQAYKAGAGQKPETMDKILEASGNFNRYNWVDLTKYEGQVDTYANAADVYKAVSKIARDGSLVKLNIFRLQGEKKVAIVNHEIERLFQHPNDHQSGIEFMEGSLTQLLLTGNCYWFLAGQPGGKPEQLYLLRTDRMSVNPGTTADRPVNGYVYTVGGTKVPLEPEQIVHFTLYNPKDDYYGLSPLEAGKRIVHTSIGMMDFNRNYFGQDKAVPAGVVNIKNMISDGDYERVQTEWRTAYGGTQRKTAFIRGADVTYEDIGLSHKDMDFVNGLQYTKEDLLQIYGLNAALFDKQTTEANALAATDNYSTFTLWPLMVRMGSKVTLELCPFYGSDLICEPDDIRRKDAEAERRQMQAEAPFLSVNEIRVEHLNKDPYPHPLADIPTLLLPKPGVSGGSPLQDNPEGNTDPVESAMGGKAQIEAPKNYIEAEIVIPRLRLTVPQRKELAQFATYAGKGKDVDRFAFLQTPLPIELAAKALADIGAHDLLSYKADGQTYSREERKYKVALQGYFTGLSSRIVKGIQHSASTKALPDPKRIASYFDSAFWANELNNLKGTLLGIFHDAVEASAVDAANVLSMSTGIPVDTSAFTNYASKYAATYTDQVLKGFNSTTRDGVGAIIARYASDDSATLDDLISAVQESGLFSGARAELVARTEATRAFGAGEYAAGEELANTADVDVAVSQDEMNSIHPAHPGDRCNFTAAFQYDDAGNITGLDYVWNTVNDEKVCPICDPRNGKTLREIIDERL